MLIKCKKKENKSDIINSKAQTNDECLNKILYLQYYTISIIHIYKY